MVRRSASALILLAALVASCSSGGDDAAEPIPQTAVAPTATAAPQQPPPRTTPEPPPIATEDAVEALIPEVVSVRPHDPEAFTQGLSIEEGRLFESTGLYGSSTLRELDPTTGTVVRAVALDDAVFGEGLDLIDDRLVMLTYQEGKAFVFDRDTFEVIGDFSYDTEGWGLCYDGARLVMSDGTETLVFRDPETFTEIGSVEVTIGGEQVERINELECVDGEVWANIWYTDFIYRIDPTTGEVTGVVDASKLLATPLDDDGAVLNGIAYDDVTQTWLVTGKLWPSMFEVRFVPEAGSS
jgi:glutaminyl-peptide cyclotransferase